MTPCIRIDRSNGVEIITFARPETGNALTADMAAALAGALRRAAEEDVRCVLLRGAGRHLSTGGDVRALAELALQPAEARRAAMDRLLRAAEPMLLGLVELPVPLVLACRGVLAGGALALALAADVVLAEEGASFRFSHLTVGLPPDGGLSWLLPRLVGPRRAFALIADGAVLDARAAEEAGIVTSVCRADEVDAAAEAAARRLAGAAPGALRAAKRLLCGEARGFAAQLAAERAAVVEAAGGDAFAERIRAFAGARR